MDYTNCSSPLGMENRMIPDKNITASSQLSSATGPENSRLNFEATESRECGWRANQNDTKPWIQVDFDSLTKITGVATQGDGNHWVTKYQLSYGVNGGKHFIPYKTVCPTSNYSFFL